MPAQKRSSADNFDQCLQLIKQEDVEQQEQEQEDDDEEQEQEREREREREQEQEQEQEQEEEQEEQEEGEEEEESTNGSYKDDEDGSNNDEYVSVNLADMRKEVQCPICLGIIRKTRTVMECLHRFCRECIDKSMRMGNNECPACRTHCASRRSLRDDPNYDALIAALYQDIDKYEAEELAFRDEEKSRNKQIQASIAQTFRRQTEALGKKRTTAKAVAAFMKRSRGRRGRSSRNSRAAELQGSDDEEDGNGNEGGRDSSSADERSAEIKSKRCKRWSGPRFSQPSSAVDADGGGCDGNDDFEVNRESTVASPGLLGSPEVLAWGRGGVRSHTRYGSVSGNGKNGRNRIAKLVDYLRSTEENLDKLDIHLIVVPLDEQSVPSLEEPFLCCRPTLTVGYLNQFVALQTQLQAEEVEILVVKEPRFSPSSDESIPNLDPNKDKLQLVEEQETLGELLASCNFSGGHLVLAYRQKVSR